MTLIRVFPHLIRLPRLPRTLVKRKKERQVCLSFSIFRPIASALAQSGVPRQADCNPRESATELVQPEIHFYANLYGHGLAILHGRFELPLANRFDRLFIQPHAKFASYTDLLRSAVRVDNHP